MNTTQEKYDGWKNYETWCANLHIMNDMGEYVKWKGRASDIWKRSTESEVFTRKERATFDLADDLKEDFDELAESALRQNCFVFFADMLRFAMSEVSWRQIAEDLIDDAIEKDGDDTDVK